LATTSGELPHSTANDLIANLFSALGLSNPPNCLRVPCANDLATDIDFFPEIIYPWDDNSYLLNSCPAAAPGYTPADCVYQIHDGDPNPNWQGAWATFRPGIWVENEDYAKARALVSDKSYFAGEALCPAWQGFQHGAWESGRHQARTIIYELYGMSNRQIKAWEKLSNNILASVGCEVSGIPQFRNSKTQ